MNNELFTIRDAVKEDESFIYSTWLLGLRHGNEWFLSIDKDTYFNNYKIVIGLLLKRSIVKVACLPDDHDVALGYVVYDGSKLHWAFTKKSWRKLGIAKALIPQGINTCTHITKLGKQLKPKTWMFNPFFT